MAGGRFELAMEPMPCHGELGEICNFWIWHYYIIIIIRPIGILDQVVQYVLVLRHGHFNGNIIEVGLY